MNDPVDDRLRALHRAVCEDALFALCACEPGALEGVLRRRQDAHDAIARDGGSVATMRDFDPWVEALVRAAAAVAAPWFVPMRHAIDDGLTLERGPSGLRALVPIGVERERAEIRRDAALAVRVARTVAAADAAPGDDERRALELLLVSLGLPDDDARVLRAETPIPIPAIDVPAGLDPKVARAIVAGAWQTAAADGLDDHEREALSAVALRLGVAGDAVAAIEADALRHAANDRAIGDALVDVVRYVLAAAPKPERDPLALAAIHLSVPADARRDAVRVVTADGATPLGRAHALDREARARVLAAAWAGALALDPRASSRARLRARHERAAAHLGAERQADDARALVDGAVDAALDRGALLAGA